MYSIVIAAKPMADYRVAVKFKSGDEGVYDCRYLLKDDYWAALRNEKFFKQVKAEYGTLCWPGDIDVPPESVWQRAIKDAA